MTRHDWHSATIADAAAWERAHGHDPDDDVTLAEVIDAETPCRECGLVVGHAGCGGAA